MAQHGLPYVRAVLRGNYVVCAAVNGADTLTRPCAINVQACTPSEPTEEANTYFRPLAWVSLARVDGSF